MTTTQLPARRKIANKPRPAPVRPVTDVLLELTYLLHATKIIGYREAPPPRQTSGRSL